MTLEGEEVVGISDNAGEGKFSEVGSGTIKVSKGVS